MELAGTYISRKVELAVAADFLARPAAAAGGRSTSLGKGDDERELFFESSESSRMGHPFEGNPPKSKKSLNPKGPTLLLAAA